MSFELSLDPGSAANKIVSYDSNSVTINSTKYTKSLILTPTEIITDWKVKDLSELDNNSLLLVSNLSPEIIIIGSNSNNKIPSLPKLGYLLEKNIGYEIMDIGAACRSFTILASEYRNVIACLIF